MMIPTSTEQNQDHKPSVQLRLTFWDSTLICFLFVILFIYYRYIELLPLKVPTHFNSHGIADGWTSREHLGWLLLGLPSLLWLFLMGINFLMSHVNIPSEASWQKEIGMKVLGQLRGVIPLGIGVTIAGTTFLPIFFNISISKFIFGALGFLVIVILLILRGVQNEIPRGHQGHYRWGLIYVNQDDPLVWVPRLGGMGLTLNFAHKMAYVWLIFLLLPGFLILFFI